MSRGLRWEGAACRGFFHLSCTRVQTSRPSLKVGLHSSSRIPTWKGARGGRALHTPLQITQDAQRVAFAADEAFFPSAGERGRARLSPPGREGPAHPDARYAPSNWSARGWKLGRHWPQKRSGGGETRVGTCGRALGVKRPWQSDASLVVVVCVCWRVRVHARLRKRGDHGSSLGKWMIRHL